MAVEDVSSAAKVLGSVGADPLDLVARNLWSFANYESTAHSLWSRDSMFDMPQ